MKRLLCRLKREVDAVGQKTGRHTKRLGQSFDGVEVGDSDSSFQVSTGVVCHTARQRECRATEVRAFARAGKSLGESEM